MLKDVLILSIKRSFNALCTKKKEAHEKFPTDVTRIFITDVWTSCLQGGEV